jgi:hypothetical protein
MLKREDFRQYSNSGEWFITLPNGTDLVFSATDNPPSENLIKQAEGIITNLDVLVSESLKYIDIWVDRDRPGVGRRYELYALYMIADKKQVKLEFIFREVEFSEWWVSFNMLHYRCSHKPMYWPVSFGRNQTY